MAIRKKEEERTVTTILKASLKEWRLTLMRVRKPSNDEYKQTLKVVILGITIVGIMAYLIHLLGISLLGG
ncbi:MAG TPA: protein translocase SEC61 complex subunit gamma [Pyrodictiaceae archaeon]|nr:protein translocase SEC61 complex subunit gamma [Pyrodictiaceae archaeon]HIQ55484.1 protein translocase SEC61 complex subunit gamma [Pyrodictium sp.]